MNLEQASKDPFLKVPFEQSRDCLQADNLSFLEFIDC